MPVGAEFLLSKIVVVESLEPHERETGREICEFINTSTQAAKLGLFAQYHACDNAPEFRDFVRALTVEVLREGRVPLLHVECHGGKDIGLEFRNGSVLSWAALSDLLVELNRATRFNLLAVFSSCYGAHFLSQVDSINPAPCYAMIAPTDSALDFELVNGFRQFYGALFSNKDAGFAVDTISRMKLMEGEWFAHLAEFWYESVTVGYVETHCTRSETKQRALRMLRKLQAQGLAGDLGTLKRGLIEAHRRDLLGRFFDTYFMTNTIPQNTQRFAAARKRIQNRIDSLRRTGRHAI